MILHTLNASGDSTAFRDCTGLLRKGDAVLLLGDGVYCALSGTDAAELLKSSPADLYLLHADGAAAGILNRIDASTTVVDYDAFVSLSEQFPKQLAWF